MGQINFDVDQFVKCLAAILMFSSAQFIVGRDDDRHLFPFEWNRLH